MRTVPFAVWRLMLAYALMMGGTALTVLLAGIIGVDFAPTPGLATPHGTLPGLLSPPLLPRRPRTSPVPRARC